MQSPLVQTRLCNFLKVFRDFLSGPVDYVFGPMGALRGVTQPIPAHGGPPSINKPKLETKQIGNDTYEKKGDGKWYKQ